MQVIFGFNGNLCDVLQAKGRLARRGQARRPEGCHVLLLHDDNYTRHFNKETKDQLIIAQQSVAKQFVAKLNDLPNICVCIYFSICVVCTHRASGARGVSCLLRPRSKPGLP